MILLLVIFLVGCTTNNEVKEMKLTSSAFENNELIPSKYTCDGENVNPPLEISEVPIEAKSLVLIMEDPDIPTEVKKSMNIEMFDHWVVFNIPVNVNNIPEASIPPGVQGSHTREKAEYTGPCPPKQYQPSEHRYFFKLYALDVSLDLSEGTTKAEVEQAMSEHILEQTELIGRYERE